MEQRERQALDRHITGNGGEDSVAQEGVLSAECEQELANEDMFSQPEFISNEWASVRDADGTHLFTVTRTIDLLDLRGAIRFGRRQYTVGLKQGHENLAYQLRNLIGAAPLEP